MHGAVGIARWLWRGVGPPVLPLQGKSSGTSRTGVSVNSRSLPTLNKPCPKSPGMRVFLLERTPERLPVYLCRPFSGSHLPRGRWSRYPRRAAAPAPVSLGLCFGAFSIRAGSMRSARCNPDAPMYTFWDYKRNRWQRDAGLRIDHLLLNPKAAKRLVEAGVDREVRGVENASDHAPRGSCFAMRRPRGGRRFGVRRSE